MAWHLVVPWSEPAQFHFVLQTDYERRLSSRTWRILMKSLCISLLTMEWRGEGISVCGICFCFLWDLFLLFVGFVFLFCLFLSLLFVCPTSVRSLNCSLKMKNLVLVNIKNVDLTFYTKQFVIRRENTKLRPFFVKWYHHGAHLPISKVHNPWGCWQ